MNWTDKVGNFLVDTGLHEVIDGFFDAGAEKIDNFGRKGMATINAAERVSMDPVGAFGDMRNRRSFEEGELTVTRGDVIGVSRGAYWHYAIYVNQREIIHYTSLSSDIGKNSIMKTGFKHFLRNADEFFVVDFDAEPAAYRVGNTGPLHSYGKLLRSALGDRPSVYSANETIERARGLLGKREYNLLGNNCEHFAMWCKTGVKSSVQVEGNFSAFLDAARVRAQLPESKARRS